jgi:lysophospholipase L1-like esterase
MSTEHFNPANHHDNLVQHTAHDIEHRFQHGENLHHVLNDEIHQLRNHEYSHGHFSGQNFKHDLKKLEQKLQNDHILPHIHIHTSGKHAGSIDSIGSNGQSPAHKSDRHHVDGSKGDHPSRSSHSLDKAERHAPGVAGEAPKASLKPHSDAGAAGEVARPSLRPHSDAGAAGEVARPQTKPHEAGDADVARPGHTAGASLGKLKDAIDQARASGRPLNMVQIGDSHIAAGIETSALADGLSKRFGVKVDYKNDGINGAHSGDALTNPGFFLKDLNKDTNLVVVSFGSNDATVQAGSAYRHDYEKLLGDIRTRAPNATLVMVGPTDGAYWKDPNRELVGLDSVTREQRAAAATVPNSDYFDIRAKLGTIQQMRSHGWMDDSNLHFTPDGYHVIGDSIAKFIKDRAN